MPPQVPRIRTILVVDDNWDLLRVISRGLEARGFFVITAETRDDAIELIRTDPSVDVVLTDGVMPGAVQGWDLAGFVKRRHPEIPMVLMSGYIGQAEVRVRQTPQIDHFRPKPIKFSELSVVLGKLLEEKKVAAVSAVG